MSTIKLSSITNKTKTSGTVIVGVTSSTATGYAQMASGDNSERVGIESGSIRYNSTAKVLEFYDGTSWNFIIPAQESANAIGVFNGNGYMDYITISSTGNSIEFGTLIYGGNGACSSNTRGVFGGNNVMEYITISSKGNSTDFGDTLLKMPGGCSSSTRGVFGGSGSPSIPGYFLNTMEYITIATTGNSTDFGDLGVPKTVQSACSSSTRGIFAGGAVDFSGTGNNRIDYITIASKSDSTYFGDLLERREYAGGCSSSTRGVFAGAYIKPARDTIEYITIATTGNGIYFGDLTKDTMQPGAVSSSTRGVFGGGYNYSPGSFTNLNTIEYITISTIGNSIPFGNLIGTGYYSSACSNNHGGLL
jgi:hypothetical protein